MFSIIGFVDHLPPTRARCFYGVMVRSKQTHKLYYLLYLTSLTLYWYYYVIDPFFIFLFFFFLLTFDVHYFAAEFLL